MSHSEDRGLIDGSLSRDRRWVWPTAGMAVSGAVTMSVAVAISRIDHRHGAGSVWLTLEFLPLLSAGVLIAALRPRSPLGWMLLAVATAAELGQLQRTMATQPWAMSNGWVAWAGDVLWWLAVPLVPAVVMLLPDGRLRSRRWRPIFVATLVLWALLGVAIMFAPGPLGGMGDDQSLLVNPVGIERLGAVLHQVGRSAQVGLLVVLVVGTVGFAMSWWHAQKAARRRLLWLGCPVVVGLLALVGATASGDGEGVAAQIGLLMLFVLLPVGLCASVLSSDLASIDLLASRALVYGLVAAMLTGAYVLLALSVGSLVPGSSRDLGVVVATAAVAVSFAPVRDRIRVAVDRRLFGATANHAAAVAQLGRALTPLGERPALASLVDALAETLAAPYVQLTAADGTAVSRGRADGPLIRRALVWGGRPAGELVIGLPVRLRRLRSHDGAIELVDTLCPFVAVALCEVSMAQEVQESRAGLVAAIEDERRRIRRDLHDGLGPALAGIGLGLETIGNLPAAQNPEIRGRLARVRDDVANVYDDLRLLARGLRPPPLDELGLVGALRSQAARLQGGCGPLAVRVDVVDHQESIGSLPAAVELAAYHVVMEAMTNVVRHAGASSCAVTLTRSDDLMLEVRDDGCGIGEHAPGVGLQSMRDRCEQLGGRLDLAQVDNSGTIVTARLPIR